MQTLSSAMRTCIALESAVEWIATVWMPISLQARWMRSAISPRLAIRTLLNMRRPRRGPAGSFQDDQRRAELHRRAVLDQDALDPARRAAAGIWFIVFIASMIRIVWPSVTVSPTFTKAGASGSACR